MLSEITAAMAEAYFERRYEDVGRETAQREISTLRAILYKAHRQGVLERVPTFPRFKIAKPRKRWLSLEEEDRLVRSAAPHFAALIRFAVETGGRRYELLMLDWRQLELEERRRTFLDTKNGEDRITRLSRRASAVPASLGPKPSGPVFTYNGKPIKCVKTSLRRACQYAGFNDAKLHDLRHTFASRLVQGGVRLYEAQELLGHKSIAMVRRHAHLAPDLRDAAIDVLDNLGHSLGTPGSAEEPGSVATH